MTAKPVGQVVKKALDNGLIVMSAGADVIRLVPPLVIEKERYRRDGGKAGKSIGRLTKMGVACHSLVLYGKIACNIFVIIWKCLQETTI